MKTTLHNTHPTTESAVQRDVLMTVSHDSHTSVSSLTIPHTIIDTVALLGWMSTRQNLFSTESNSEPEDGDSINNESDWIEDLEEYSDD